MKISSRIHWQPGKVQFVVLDVLADEKPFLAAILLGDTSADSATLTSASNECLRLLVAMQTATSNNDRMHIVEVRNPSIVAERVSLVASKVERHDAVAFICIDKSCYDLVFSALNIIG